MYRPRQTSCAAPTGSKALSLAATSIGSGVLAVGALAAPQFPLSDPIPLLTPPLVPMDSVLADFSGDGHLDVMFRSSTRFGLDITLGDGNGAFGPSQSIALEVGVVDVAFATGDLGGDGDIDIVAVGGNGSTGAYRLQVMDNDGTGTFTVTTLPGNAAGYDNLQLLDVTGDGALDIVFSRRPSGVLQLAFLAAQGGTFADQPVTIPTDGASFWELADVNGDGLADVTTPDLSGSLRVAYGLGGGAFGTAARPPVLGGDLIAYPAIFEDIDQDGNIDAVQREGQALKYFSGQGSGSFSAAQVLGRAIAHNSGLIDIDADGDLDIVSTELQPTLPSGGYAQEVYLQTSPGAFAPGVPTGLRLLALDQLGDIDGDGRTDVLRRSGNGFIWQLNNLSPAAGYFGPIQRLTPPLLAYVWFSSVADVDSDGDDDLIVNGSPDSKTIWLENTASGLTAPPQVLIQGRAWQTRATDYDGDGDQDLVTLRLSVPPVDTFLEVRLNDGAQNYTLAFPPLHVAGNLNFLDIEDFNGDGLPDILTTTSVSTGSYFGRLFLSAGPASAPTESTVVDAALNAVDIHQGEFTGDSIPDLVITVPAATSGQWEVQLLPGLGGGTFGAATTVPGLRGSRHHTVGDLNGDGLDDLLVASVQDGVLAARSIGSGAFSAPEVLVDFRATDPYARVQSVDFDGDGDLDLIVPPLGTLLDGIRLSLVEQRSPGVFSDPFPITGRAYIIERPPYRFADLDGDGDEDCITVENGAIFANLNQPVPIVGSSFCTGTSPSPRGYLAAVGSDVAADNQLTLRASDITPGVFGIAVGSRTIGPAVPVALGNLCLTGAIGRYNAPGQILDSGASGMMTLDLDLGALRLPNGTVPAQAGDSWSFQIWHRQPTPTGTSSRFTTGVSVLLR